MAYSRLLRTDATLPIVNGTTWECYDVGGVDVYVKREDLCSPYPGPQFSKIRGLFAHLQARQADGLRSVGILDTSHSKAGWAVAYCCSILGMTAYDFFPVPKALVGGSNLHHQQCMAANLGAILVPMAATAGYVLEPVAKKLLASMDSAAEMLPVGLKLPEAIDANVAEVLAYTPKELMAGSWFVSTSSGTIAAGLWKAIQQEQAPIRLHCHLGYSRPVESVRAYIKAMSGYDAKDVYVIDEGYEYADGVSADAIPFPCNPYYDAKAWNHLMNYDLATLPQPVIFWNVGA